MQRKLLSLLLLAAAGLSACSDDKPEVPAPTPGPDDATVVIPDDKAPEVIASKSYFIVNEDWFGHEQGSTNRIWFDGRIDYRAYRKANPGYQLGVTSQFAMNYGGNIYFMSKQAPRLVVADAETLKKKVAFDVLEGGGDGRAAVGVDAKTVYISSTAGIRIFRVNKMVFGEFVKGSESNGGQYNGQTGEMVHIGNRVFAAKQNNGVLVIDAVKHEVEGQIKEATGALCASKDGYLWVATTTKELWKIDPYTLETVKKVSIPSAISIGWGAWRPSSLCASTQHNVLYWSAGGFHRYDIDKDELTKLATAPSGLPRVEPLTDEVTGTNGMLYDGTSGILTRSYTILGGMNNGVDTENDPYPYWFASHPFFEDRNAPAILMNQVILKPGETIKICLSDKVTDADNASKLINKRLTFNTGADKVVEYEVKQDTLYLHALNQTGKTLFTFNACSNGRETEKEVRIDVRQ